MTVKFYEKNDTYLIGTTMKSHDFFEDNNMALHVAKNKREVIENRKSLARMLQVELEQFVFANQTHSAHFYQVTKKDTGKGVLTMETAIPDTDALYTFEENIVLLCVTADCVPVMFYHETKEVIGVIHSGWRGTVQEITLKLLQHLITSYDCAPQGFHIYIGPALSKEKFEVDLDVYEQFLQLEYAQPYMSYEPTTNKYHIDNQLVVKAQCENVGIPREYIMLDRMCTYLHAKGFSYRENKRAGRHASFIVRKK